MERVRALAEVGGVDRDLWRELADAGVFSLRLSEADGGAGLGTAEAALVFEELGRALVPGPVIGTHLAVSSLGVAVPSSGATPVVGWLERSAEPLLVEHFEALDALLVADDDGVALVEASSVDAAALGEPLDPLTPMHVAASLPPGERIGDGNAARRARIDGAVLAAAIQLGIAEAVTDAAVAYAKERVQFDRPIGAFQAVKHLCADMLVRTEMARAAVYAAGITVDDPLVGDPARAASAAKVLCGEAALTNAKTCIQVYGGMGFTWEVDIHLYLKRAWVLDTVFGTAERHAELLASVL
jgi:alkylation response protein AidB-like acyl-CoA dehydrogenase